MLNMARIIGHLGRDPDVRIAAPSSALAELGIDVGTWKVLTESIFPSAKTPEGVLLAVRYCQARKLDIMRRSSRILHGALGCWRSSIAWCRRRCWWSRA